MKTMKIVVVGGSAAGAKAAAKARRLDQSAQITIIQKDPDLSMASCGYPYYVGGTFDNRNALLATPTGVVRDPGFFQKTKDIKALVQTECVAVNREARQVECRDLQSGEKFFVEYDKLILCMGGKPKRIPVPGTELEGVTHLLSMADTDYLHRAASSKEVQHAVVIGGGLIGVEACEALVSRGIKVTLVEMESQILTMLDWQMAKLVENHMKSKGVDVRVGTRLETLTGEGGRLSSVTLGDGTVIPCELAVLATGVEPITEPAAGAGLAIGELGGIAVNEYMQTSDEHIYAAGDCVECVNMITGNKVLAPMGDLANLQGRVAGENVAMGNSVTFSGTTQTAICKVFDFGAGVTGLTEKQAKKASVAAYETVVNASPDKPGFMGAGLLISKMVVNSDNDKILGCQCVGSGDVSRQLATMAMAVRAGMTVTDLATADLPYAPPYSLAIDHSIATAHIMGNKLKGRFKSISAEEVWQRIQDGNPPFFLDGRGPDEYEVLRLGIGEKYIPLGMLRNKLDELPRDKGAEIVCFCKISLRGYETALILEANGWTNVKVMEGGIMAWPFAREA
ncbi:FAD-dependent oxidoreductase [Desulforhopalus singaporensis]|uniref:NADPH-dependent 2,4-dienoyl-CoA reductase, sulfur reductase n=1 Tax=Desulforhopalus singaporensis TaxID=91360 RepID=A0A1H0SW09_9BACT|nr:FAD-dependent oxidoreductase [Desulforhopalus singaporensis]SDP46002.1 NADPH-dependent 2,4-dienoyl-CoA reductase, sulfur reductase [Desulforhopalus singaporensis]